MDSERPCQWGLAAAAAEAWSRSGHPLSLLGAPALASAAACSRSSCLSAQHSMKWLSEARCRSPSLHIRQPNKERRQVLLQVSCLLERRCAVLTRCQDADMCGCQEEASA